MAITRLAVSWSQERRWPPMGVPSLVALVAVAIACRTPAAPAAAHVPTPALQAPAVLVLRGRIIDGTGAPPISRGVLVIVGDRIRCVGTTSLRDGAARDTAAHDCPVPAGAREIDVGAGTILPGLVELHTHLKPHFLGRYLPAGVTTVRDAANDVATLDSLRAAPGPSPRLVWTGPLVDGPRSIWPGFYRSMGLPDSVVARLVVTAGTTPVTGVTALVTGTPAEARAAVDSVAAHGAGWLKLYSRVTPAVTAAAVAAARARGLRVMAHLADPVRAGAPPDSLRTDALEAARAGVASLEHASGVALAYQRLGGDPRREPFDSALVDRIVGELVARRVALVPTLSVFWGEVSGSARALDALPDGDRVPEDMRTWFARQAGAGVAPERRATAATAYRLLELVTRRAQALGGVVGAGSDAPAGLYNLAGGGLHRELALLVRAGLTPAQALHAATGAASQLLGRTDLGVLAPGRLADVLVVGGDPTQDIAATRDVRAVILGGRLLPLDSLRAALGPSTRAATR